MRKLLLMLIVLALASFALAGEKKDATLTGWVSDSMCAAKHTKPASEGCVKGCIEKGAKPVLVTDGDGKVLGISNPEKIKGHEGHYIQVKGTTSGDTVEIAEVKMLEQPDGADKKDEHKH